MTLYQKVELEIVDEEFCAAFNSHSITIVAELLGFPFAPYDSNAALSRIEVDYPIQIISDDDHKKWHRHELLILWGKSRLQKIEELLCDQEQQDDWESQES